MQIAPEQVTSTERTFRDAATGDTIDGRYLLTREIARGGMGIVSEVSHRVLGKPAAIKLLHREFYEREVTRKRLLREARALFLSRNPGIVQAEDAGVCPIFGPYIVMERLHGRTLDGILTARMRLKLEETLMLGDQLCRALTFAHSQAVVHRDVKPSNVFIANDGLGGEVAKLIDFSIAKVDGDWESVREKLTVPGEVVGTFDYMSPEQLLGQEDVDERADQYAVGALLFECISGRTPYVGGYQGLMRKLVRNERCQQVSELCPDVPAHVSEAIWRSLAPAREDRFDSVEEFRAALMGALPRWHTGLLRGEAPRPIHSSRTASPLADSATRRVFARAPYQTHVQVGDDAGRHVRGRTEDISEGGLMLYTKGSLPSDKSLTLTLAIPFVREPVRIRVEVQWVRTSRGRHVVGVQFVDPSREMLAAIADYVSEFNTLVNP